MSTPPSRSRRRTGSTADTGTHVRSSWRAVALPSEHGGWSLTAEPAVLGLLVAWSVPGLALGVAAMVAFVARTPLKLVLVDRWRHRRLDRTRLAAGIASIELVVLALLVVAAASAGEPRFWMPLVFAGPLMVLELWYDMRSRGRRLIPELAGSIAIGSIATAIALADGAPTRIAWGLWVVIAARSVAAIPYVRTQISRTRSRPGPIWYSDIAQLAVVGAALIGWTADLIPAAAAIVLAAVGVMNLLAVRAGPRRAVVIGIQQTVVGLAVIATTAVAIGLN